MQHSYHSGDYAILLSTGLSWYAALLLNFFSSLMAIIGFFVGVAVGTESAESNRWILTIAVGLFLYVALVDLVSSNPLLLLESAIGSEVISLSLSYTHTHTHSNSFSLTYTHTHTHTHSLSLSSSRLHSYQSLSIPRKKAANVSSMS